MPSAKIKVKNTLIFLNAKKMKFLNASSFFTYIHNISSLPIDLNNDYCESRIIISITHQYLLML